MKERKVSAGKARLDSARDKTGEFFFAEPHKDIFVSSCLRDAHTHIIRTARFLSLNTILGAGIQRCRTESNGLAFIGKNKVMGVDGKSIKSNAYFSIRGRADRQRQISPQQQRKERESLTSPAGTEDIFHLRIDCTKVIKTAAYLNASVSWLEIQFQTSTASAPTCIGTRELMCARGSRMNICLLNYNRL